MRPFIPSWASGGAQLIKNIALQSDADVHFNIYPSTHTHTLASVYTLIANLSSSAAAAGSDFGIPRISRRLQE
jgi:hypothetical protein